MLNVRSAVRYVECEDSARVHHEGDDARRYKYGDEEGGDGVEACPAVKLDEEGRDDDTNRTQRVLQKDTSARKISGEKNSRCIPP